MNAKSLCAVAAAITLGLAACGDDDDEETAGTTTGMGTQAEQAPPDEPPTETVRLTETEFKIEPADVEVAEAGVVKFRVENAGAFPHALEVESEDLEEETEHISPGETATLAVDLPAGSYELYCPIGDHEDRGMVGTLTVGGASSAPSDDDAPGSDDDAPGSDDNSGGAQAPESGDDSGGAEAPSSGY